MEPGAKCICSENELYNAFGEQCSILKKGMRLTVKERRNFFGTNFYFFEETPEGHCYMSTAFTPLRNLN